MSFQTPRFFAPCLLILMALSACASIDRRGLDPSYHARGPGTVFPTLDEAVVDALAFAHIEGNMNGTAHRIRGGVITRTGDGFTYDRVELADPARPTHIEYSLGQHDVARFHAYPISLRPSENQRNETPSRADRKSVNSIDPLHRPLYILTPRLDVKAYHGQGQSIATVVNLRQIETESLLAGSAR